ncbi:unnamed protein product [Ambrosiozyma monospora]|uniref:Unnamed protein product n=1 Tax=Ambrosiozyma monospora TaxID=43982 RepID=A0A9W6YS03_AMBMO|nr:unnamed protein product [Ambrosiozyma monospora]
MRVSWIEVNKSKSHVNTMSIPCQYHVNTMVMLAGQTVHHPWTKVQGARFKIQDSRTENRGESTNCTKDLNDCIMYHVSCIMYGMCTVQVIYSNVDK